MNRSNEKILEIINALRKWPKWALILATSGVVVLLGVAMFFLIPRTPISQDGTQPLSSAGLAFNVFLKLFVVILIILGLSIIVKRWQGNNRVTNSKQISIIETVNLSPHRSLHLIEIHGKKLLIGATDQSITSLADFSDADGFVDETYDKPNRNNFSDYLNQASENSESRLEK